MDRETSGRHTQLSSSGREPRPEQHRDQVRRQRYQLDVERAAHQTVEDRVGLHEEAAEHRRHGHRGRQADARCPVPAAPGASTGSVRPVDVGEARATGAPRGRRAGELARPEGVVAQPRAPAAHRAQPG